MVQLSPAIQMDNVSYCTQEITYCLITFLKAMVPFLFTSSRYDAYPQQRSILNFLSDK